MVRVLSLLAVLFSMTYWTSLGQNAKAPVFSVEMLDTMTSLPGNLGALPPRPSANQNANAAVTVELGKLLFFDKRLSKEGSLSCASCHDPAKAFSDARSLGVGVGGKVLTRRTPSVLNSAYNPLQFWDGRASSLEEQASMPMLSAAEMGVPDRAWAVDRLQRVPHYRELFRKAFGEPITFDGITTAIAAFERTLTTPYSAFDRYVKGDKQALTSQQKRGLILFFSKASCTECHNGPNFTDNQFHALGRLPGEEQTIDLGRFGVTKNPADRGAFKTPTLRNIALRAPYMHNGSLATLADVVALYNRGGGPGEKSDLLHPLDLTPDEQSDLLSFLDSLAGVLPQVEPPILPADKASH
jgi:cytochrome c peroxidase